MVKRIIVVQGVGGVSTPILRARIRVVYFPLSSNVNLQNADQRHRNY